MQSPIDETVLDRLGAKPKGKQIPTAYDAMLLLSQRPRLLASRIRL
jgi:hypothetical protein